MKKLSSKQLYFAFACAIVLAGPAFAADPNASDSYNTNSGSDSGMSGSGTSEYTPSEKSNTMKSDRSSQSDTVMGSSDKGNNADLARSEIPHAEVTFSENQVQLSDADKANLRNMIRDARAKGDLEKVTVAVWSDKQLPRQDQKLMDSDRELASNRAEAISSFIQDELKVDVQTYNMAENSHWLARAFGTKEADLKSVFGRKGSEEAPITNEEFRVIKDAGGPSKAVVVAEHKRPSKSSKMKKRRS